MEIEELDITLNLAKKITILKKITFFKISEISTLGKLKVFFTDLGVVNLVNDGFIKIIEDEDVKIEEVNKEIVDIISLDYAKFLDLPKLEVIQKTLKSISVNSPNIDMFNSLQREIFNCIVNLNVNTFSQTLLTGYSGTGKSFLVSKIIEELIYKNIGLNIAITAPTNKAVRVLKDLSSICETHSRVSFITLHSLLGLKREITSDGKEVYKSDFFGCNLENYNIVLVDEVSMLDNELYCTLVELAEMNNIMLLFIGDRGQIPPVNGGECKLFTMELENSFNLTDIIRQSDGNPIIKLAEKVRRNDDFNIESDVDINGDGVIVVKLNTEMLLLETYFKSPNFNANSNFIKVLAWTNKAVDYYNSKIRGIIYGDNSPKLNIGEKMVCNKPISDSTKRVILNNNDEFEVISFSVKQDRTALKLSYYSVNVISNNKQCVIKILCETSEKAYYKELEKLKKNATDDKSYNRRNSWVKYFNYLDKFADVKYNYALTVHKSQGSTFDNGIVINCDIIRLQDKIERNKLLYTAMTRVKNKLFII